MDGEKKERGCLSGGMDLSSEICTVSNWYTSSSIYSVYVCMYVCMVGWLVGKKRVTREKGEVEVERKDER